MRNERAAESGNAILRKRSGTKAKIYHRSECKKQVQAPNKRNQSESEFGSVLRKSRRQVARWLLLISKALLAYINKRCPLGGFSNTQGPTGSGNKTS